MNNRFENKGLSAAAESLLPFQLKIELIAVAVIVLAFLLQQQVATVSRLLFAVSFSVLAIMYYLLAFRPQPADTPMGLRFTYRIIGLGQAVSLVGIQFSLLHFPGAGMMSLVGGLALGVASAALVMMRNLNKADRKATQFDLLRAFLILTILFLQYQSKGSL